MSVEVPLAKEPQETINDFSISRVSVSAIIKRVSYAILTF